MADTKGFIICDHAHCNEIAEVRQASGNRSSLYTVCPVCKTDQSNGQDRQRWLLANMVPEDQIHTLKAQEPEPPQEPEHEAEEDTVKPSVYLASSQNAEAEEADSKPTTKPKNKPTIPAKAPLIAGCVLVLLALIFGILRLLKGKKNDTATA